MSSSENKGSKGKKGIKIRQPFGKKGAKYAVDFAKPLQPVNSAVTGTSAVQVKETRKGHISVRVNENEIDGNGNIKTASPKNRHKGSNASPKKPRRQLEKPASSDGADDVFFNGDVTDIPPNMVKNREQISKTYNYSYSRSGKVKENSGRRASLDDVNKRFAEELTVKPDSAMDL